MSLGGTSGGGSNGSRARTRNRCVNTQQLPRESGAASSGSIQAGATQLRGQGATGQSRSGATGNVVGCDFWEPGLTFRGSTSGTGCSTAGSESSAGTLRGSWDTPATPVSPARGCSLAQAPQLRYVFFQK